MNTWPAAHMSAGPLGMNSTLIGTLGKNIKKCIAAWKSVFTE